jgi:hypothetical protein
MLLGSRVSFDSAQCIDGRPGDGLDLEVRRGPRSTTRDRIGANPKVRGGAIPVTGVHRDSVF